MSEQKTCFESFKEEYRSKAKVRVKRLNSWSEWKWFLGSSKKAAHCDRDKGCSKTINKEVQFFNVLTPVKYEVRHYGWENDGKDNGEWQKGDKKSGRYCGERKTTSGTMNVGYSQQLTYRGREDQNVFGHWVHEFLITSRWKRSECDAGPGYIAKNGDIGGWGKVNGEGGGMTLKWGASACRLKCEAHNGTSGETCKSYEYSIKDNKCSLNTGASPNQKGDYKDYEFCTKEEFAE